MYVCAVDDGVYPLLGNIGPSSIALFTGSTFQQSWLANIAEEIDVSKVGTVNWAVDPNVGPSGKPKLVMSVGNYYFIRFTSKNLKDTTEAAYPHTAYSAKFTCVFSLPLHTHSLSLFQFCDTYPLFTLPLQLGKHVGIL
jgi:hypothetical protein